MTKDEFELLSTWARHGFWDLMDTEYVTMDADEFLRMSLACQVMARIKLAAGGKRNKVTEAFVKQYSANVQMIREQMKREQELGANVEELIDPTTAYNSRYAEWVAEDTKKAMKAAGVQVKEEGKTND
jgi:ABC-type Fe3+/spermidine/putrescine transport system ATPase subunit